VQVPAAHPSQQKCKPWPDGPIWKFDLGGLALLRCHPGKPCPLPAAGQGPGPRRRAEPELPMLRALGHPDPAAAGSTIALFQRR